MLEDVLAKMNPEKRERLIDSALKEFGTNPYNKASTNVIVKQAGISKGLLYHYFKSKEELYNYLIEFLFVQTATGIMEQIDFENQDILDRIIVAMNYKMKLFKKYPGIIEFSKSLYKDKTIEEVKIYINKYAPNYYEDFYRKNIDYTMFKEGVDVQQAINITQWTVEKLSEGYMKTWKQNEEIDMDAIKDELLKYADTLKIAFYAN